MNRIHRPKPVFIIAMIFIVLAAIDLGYLLSTSLIQQTIKFNMSGEVIGSGFKLDLFWVALYAIGAGIMRGGKFARIVACILGVIAFILPGIVLIYYLFFTESKTYFENKSCEKCGPTKYANEGLMFKRMSCKICGENIELENA
jgi:hypothetical protein